MKLRNPWVIRIAARAVAGMLRIWFRMLAIRALGWDGRAHPVDPVDEPSIYAFWHETLLVPAKLNAAVRVLISQSADGELIAQVCQRLGIGVVRGSTSRGGASALLTLLRSGPGSHLVITPDGPRGPRRQVQKGIVYLASRTGLPIRPVGIGFTRAWRAPTWDRFAVAWPGSTAVGVIGHPIEVPPDLSKDMLERYRLQVEQAMLASTAAAERWAQELARDRDALPDPSPKDSHMEECGNASRGASGSLTRVA